MIFFFFWHLPFVPSDHQLANRTPKSSKKAPNMYTYGGYKKIVHTRKHREGTFPYSKGENYYNN